MIKYLIAKILAEFYFEILFPGKKINEQESVFEAAK
jgi:hypothetical protein